MTNIERTIAQAKRLCIQHGSTLTPKRQTILLSLLQSKRALSAYELVDFCQQQFGESIPAVSVYRILDFFQRIHIAHRLHSINKFALCTHLLDDDGTNSGVVFLICKQCHQIKEQHVSRSVIESLKSEIKDDDFQVIAPQIELECLCKRCRSREQTTHTKH